MKHGKSVSVLAAAALLVSCGTEPTGSRASESGTRSVTALSVSIAGPSEVQDDYYLCTWEAIPAGGNPPYEYLWRTDTGLVSDWSTSPFLDYGFDNGPHQIRVRVHDASSNTAEVTIGIWAHNGDFGCR